MYRVIKSFEDLQDDNHKYNVGDVYPYDGKEVRDSRINELSTSKNKRGIPLIVKEERARRNTQSRQREKTLF